MRCRHITLAAVLALNAANAQAYPEGAPWGAADPGSGEHCAACHWDYPAVLDSDQLQIAGLPTELRPASEYRLTLTLLDDEATISGFQLLLRGEAGPAGELRSDDDDVETHDIETAIRSTEPRPLEDDKARWQFIWRTPSILDGPVQILAAASAANNDGSPLGDQVFYVNKTLDVATASQDE